MREAADIVKCIITWYSLYKAKEYMVESHTIHSSLRDVLKMS